MQNKYCYACGKEMHESSASCPQCGASQPNLTTHIQTVPTVDRQGSNIILAANQVYCRGCGQPIHKSAPYCPKCGATQSFNSMASFDGGTKNKVVAAVLAITLGGFGAHKFYLGSIGLGIIYLLFCWTFIPAIIAFIECIVYLSMSDDEFARKYG